jgi:hypothetical protein
VRQVHVSGHNSESKLAVEMNPYEGHGSRDRGYCASVTVCDRTTRAPQSGRAFPRVTSSVQSSSTTTTDFAFGCSSGVAKPCDLLLVHPHPHPPLCAGAYFLDPYNRCLKHSFRRRSLSYGLQSSSYSTSSSEADDSQTDSSSESDEYSNSPSGSSRVSARAVRRTSHPSTSTSS